MTYCGTAARLVVGGVALSLAAGSAGMMGPKPARLDTDKVQAIDVIQVGGQTTFCPNAGAPQLKVMATLSDGRKLTTAERGESIEGKLEIGAFEWGTDIGVVDEHGFVRLPADPFALVDRTVTITARVAGKPEIASEIVLAPRFDCGGTAVFAGEAGRAGAHGAAGRGGRVGDSGNSSKDATDGEDGQDGQDASDGGDGGPGPALEVAVGYVATEQHGRLVLVRVSPLGATSPASYWLIDREGAPFTLAALGGDGGAGGAGGDGGSGGSGGSNNISGAGDGGNGGDGGDGGRGGNGGDGGDGGEILVRFDARHPELRALVRTSTAGGSGGYAGSGGRGGSLGTGGSSASGKRGVNGRAGVSGSAGQRRGRDGREGPPARVSGADAARLFADELARGIAIVR